MSDRPAVACADMCAGCKDECEACATMACGGCGGCDGAKMSLRARAAVAQLELHDITFGFNPGQKRGPDGRFIKMGGRGSAGKGGFPKGHGRSSALPDSAGDSTGYGSAEITDTQHRGVTRYDFTPKVGGRTRDISLLPPEGQKWADALTGPPGDVVLSQGVRSLNKKDKTLYGRTELSVAEDGSVSLRFGPSHETQPESTTVELTPTEATRLAIKMRSNADRDLRELEANRAPKSQRDSAATKRREEGLELLGRVNTLARRIPDFAMSEEELNEAYEAIDTDSPFAVEAVDKLRRVLGQYEGNVPGAIVPDAPVPVPPPVAPAVPTVGDRGPAPVGFTPRSDAEWNLIQKRLGKRTARTDPEGDLQPGDIVPTRDGKWQEVLRPDPSKFWERNGTQGWMVRDDAKGYVHGEGANTMRQQIERYAAEKAWRDAGGSKDRLDGVAKAPVNAQGLRPGEPPIGEDGKYAKPTKQYAVYNGEVYTRTSRNPYRYAAVIASRDNPTGGVWSWHRTASSAQNGTLTGDQRRSGLYVKEVIETGFEDPGLGPEINANGPAPTRAQHNNAVESLARDLVNDAIDNDRWPDGLDRFKEREISDRLQELADARESGNTAAADRAVARLRRLLSTISGVDLPRQPGGAQ